MSFSSIKHPFQPHPLLPGGHLQTLGGQLGPTPPKPKTQSTHFWVDVTDGDRLIHYVDEPAGADPTCPTVVTLHGLGGSSDSSYNLRLRNKLVMRGIRVVRFNHRGCGLDDSTAPPSRGIYHAGRTDDILAALRAIALRWPSAPFVVLGFSLSGNALLRLLGTEQAAIHALSNLISAASICSPIDLELCSQSLIKPRNTLIDQYYVHKMLNLVTQRTRLLNETLPAHYSRRMTLRDFDEFYTAPRAGFRNREEYYRLCSAKPILKDITLPTLFLAAADDPVVPAQSFDNVHFNPATAVHLEKTGGHMGFIQKKRTEWDDYRWMDTFLIDWCLHTLNTQR